ncbi:hypothetical protein C8R45DRAFT_1024805 [Mycena sanguinolenta]|nr:hypothetical protein C8R45DRAFT_1024805 [Mycena sanguinolenta]
MWPLLMTSLSFCGDPFHLCAGWAWVAHYTKSGSLSCTSAFVSCPRSLILSCALLSQRWTPTCSLHWSTRNFYSRIFKV